MAMAAPPRPVERVRNFYNRIGLPSDHDYVAELTARAKTAQEAGDPRLVDMAKRQCSSLLGFTTYRFPRYRPSEVHRLICAQLERVERREIDRLMLLLPPRHGKSELASKSYPAWSIGRAPWKMFISASAEVKLAQDWGREVRNIVATEAYQLVYETRLSEDSQAAGKWNTQQGGSYYSVGVEGGVMGRGAHDVMLDDLYANMEEAASPVIREKVWKWYSGTIYNRLEPGGAIVLINHRMHEDDLSGRVGRGGGELLDLEWASDHLREPLGAHVILEVTGKRILLEAELTRQGKETGAASAQQLDAGAIRVATDATSGPPPGAEPLRRRLRRAVGKQQRRFHAPSCT